MQDQSRWIYGRANAARTLVEIVKQHPELRDQAVRILTDALEPFETNLPEMNAFLITDLVLNLNAAEALPVIQRAFEADKVDESIMGDWIDVLEKLGQEVDSSDPLVVRSREHRHTLLTRRQAIPSLDFPRPFGVAPPAPKHESPSNKRKGKRKMASASRKANRKKKRK